MIVEPQLCVQQSLNEIRENSQKWREKGIEGRLTFLRLFLQQVADSLELEQVEATWSSVVTLAALVLSFFFFVCDTTQTIR